MKYVFALSVATRKEYKNLYQGEVQNVIQRTRKGKEET
mgnify:CR=1 FL=1